jgi:hypothetical protein
LAGRRAAVAAAVAVDEDLYGPPPLDLLQVVRDVVANVMVAELPSVGDGTLVVLVHNVEVDMLRMRWSIEVAAAVAVAVVMASEDSVVVHTPVAVVAPTVAEPPTALLQQLLTFLQVVTDLQLDTAVFFRKAVVVVVVAAAAVVV